jgi:outer membrane receptor protein involved in Fe transport
MVTLLWNTGSWQLGASVTNLFDKRQYSYTEYTSTQSYTSWVHIRGREFLASAKYRF